MKRIELIKQAQEKINSENNAKSVLTSEELKSILASEYSDTSKNADTVKTLNFN